MPADPDGIQSMQAGFLAALSSSIAQNLVMADDKDVRNKLLVAFVVFGLGAVEIEKLGRGSDHRKILLHFKTEALKEAQLFKKPPFKTQHSLFSSHLVDSVSLLLLTIVLGPPGLHEQNLLFLVNALFGCLFTFYHLKSPKS